MKIGVHLPTHLPGVGVGDVRGWARRAEQLGYADIAVTDRGADEPIQPLLAAAAALAETEHVGLITDTTFSPTWRPETEALHTASLERAAPGRLITSLTFTDPLTVVAGLDGDDALRIADAMLAETHRANHTTAPDPSPVPTRRFVGGRAATVAALVARHGDGWLRRHGSPGDVGRELAHVRAAWDAAGRSGRPTAVATLMFAVGDDAAAALEGLHHGLRVAHGPDVADAAVAGSAAGESAVRRHVAALEAAGVDEVLAVPATPDPDEIARLAAAVPQLVTA